MKGIYVILVCNLMTFYQFVDCFKTEKCNNEEVIEALRGTDKCILDVFSNIEQYRNNFCNFMDDSLIGCSEKHFAKCLTEEDLRNYHDSKINTMLALIGKSGPQFVSFLEKCPIVQEFQLSGRSGLDFSIASEKCTKEEMRLLDLKSGTCLDIDLQSSLSRYNSINRLLNILCELLQKSLSDCIEETYKNCLNKNELQFKRESLLKGQEAVFDQFKTERGIDLKSKCSAFDGQSQDIITDQ